MYFGSQEADFFLNKCWFQTGFFFIFNAILDFQLAKTDVLVNASLSNTNLLKSFHNNQFCCKFEGSKCGGQMSEFVCADAIAI